MFSFFGFVWFCLSSLSRFAVSTRAAGELGGGGGGFGGGEPS